MKRFYCDSEIEEDKLIYSYHDNGYQYIFNEMDVSFVKWEKYKEENFDLNDVLILEYE